jgi:signal transduction histidine kinase
VTTAGTNETFPDYGALAASEQPVFLWQAADGSISWANAAGCQLWGALDACELAQRQIDRAMPAVANLQRLILVLASGATDEQEFVFWLPGGSRTLRCLCQRVQAPDGTGGVLLSVVAPSVRASSPAIRVNGHAGDGLEKLNGAMPPERRASRLPKLAGPPTLAPQEAAALAEIARMIREGKAGSDSLPAAQPALETAGQAATVAIAQLGTGDPEMLGRLSHELRTPLNAIIGYGELLLSEQSGPLGSPKYRGYAGNILGAAQHCLSLVNDLFDATKLAAGEQTPEFAEVDVNETARACLGILAPIAGKAGVTLKDGLAPRIPLAIIGRRGLRQILLNLLGNAIKFTPPGGTVTVSSIYDVGTGLRVTVADTGPGMSRTSLEAARGEHDSPVTALTGLGLSISRNIAAFNGGTLTVESQPGIGTVVTLYLPMNRLLLR